MSLATQAAWIELVQAIKRKHPKRLLNLSKFADYQAFLDDDEVSDQLERFVSKEVRAFLSKRPYAALLDKDAKTNESLKRGEMKRKIPVWQLKRMIAEAVLGEGAAPPEEKDVSLDSQVDRYFSEYETEAKSAKNEGTDFRRLLRRLLEAEGETTGNEAPADDGDDPKKQGSESIDLESFANSVVRLIDNYDSLLEVRSTITRRAKNFLAKAYSPDVVDSFDKIMRDEHGIVPGESKIDVEAEEFPAPGADRAGDGGGGGGGAPV